MKILAILLLSSITTFGQLTLSGKNQSTLDTVKCVMLVSFPPEDKYGLYSAQTISIYGFVIKSKYTGEVLGYLSYKKSEMPEELIVWDYKIQNYKIPKE